MGTLPPHRSHNWYRLLNRSGISRAILVFFSVWVGYLSPSAQADSRITKHLVDHIPVGFADHLAYLPVVQAPDLLVRVIPDGDFEQGNGWVEMRGYSGRHLIGQNTPGLPVQARSGITFAWLGYAHLLGETANHQNRIITRQRIPLPQGKAFLRYYYQIISYEEPDNDGLCVYDLLNVWVENSLVFQDQICYLYNTSGWSEALIDISYLAGRNVTIEFDMRTDASNLSSVFIDDVSIINTR